MCTDSYCVFHQMKFWLKNFGVRRWLWSYFYAFLLFADFGGAIYAMSISKVIPHHACWALEVEIGLFQLTSFMLYSVGFFCITNVLINSVGDRLNNLWQKGYADRGRILRVRFSACRHV